MSGACELTAKGRTQSMTGAIAPTIAAILWLAMASTAAAGPPVKLWLGEASEPALSAYPLTLVLELRDVDNAAAAAPRDLSIELTLGLEGAAAERREVQLANGQSRHELEWTPPAGGLAVLRAEHPELRPYELLLPVVDRQRVLRGEISEALLQRLLERGVPRRELLSEPAPEPAPAPAPEPEALVVPAEPLAKVQSAQPMAIASVQRAQVSAQLATAQVATTQLATSRIASTQIDKDAAPLAAAPSAPISAPPQLTLRVSPRDGVLADGKDFATVRAFLGGGMASDRDLRLQLHSDAGRLDPRELTIARGELSASAKLTAQRSGAVQIELLGTEPPAQLAGQSVVSVAFHPPITALQAVPSPARISLIEPADVVVRLLDAEGRTLATERPRQVSITLDDGSGQLLATQLEIPAGGHEARTSFQPSGPGEVRFTVASPRLMSVGATLAVGWPWLALAVSICAGAAGGTLAWQHRRRQCAAGGAADGSAPPSWTRILAGAFTGTLLYFALLIGGGELVPAALRLNLATAFVAAAVGGWLGPRVFDLIMQRPGK